MIFWSKSILLWQLKTTSFYCTKILDCFFWHRADCRSSTPTRWRAKGPNNLADGKFLSWKCFEIFWNMTERRNQSWTITFISVLSLIHFAICSEENPTLEKNSIHKLNIRDFQVLKHFYLDMSKVSAGFGLPVDRPNKINCGADAVFNFDYSNKNKKSPSKLCIF